MVSIKDTKANRNSRKPSDNGGIKTQAAPAVDFSNNSEKKEAPLSLFALIAMLKQGNQDLLKTDELNSLSYDQLLAKGTLDQGDVFRADNADNNVRDMEVGEYIDNKTGRHAYYVGDALETFRGTRQDLGKDNFKMRSIGQIQVEMVSAIEKAAAITGVPVALLGAMAGKETMFGKGQRSSSGAEGLFQETDGYLRENYVKNKAQSALIAKHVPEAAKYFEDGQITLDEAQRLAWNPEAAAIMTGLRAKALANDKHMDLNDSRTWGLVYTDHNAGRGSLNKLLAGGMTDSWIRNLNPSMYKGASNASDVLAIADKDMRLWGARYEKLSAQMGGKPHSEVATTSEIKTPHTQVASSKVEPQSGSSLSKAFPPAAKAIIVPEHAQHSTSVLAETANHVTDTVKRFVAKLPSLDLTL